MRHFVDAISIAKRRESATGEDFQGVVALLTEGFFALGFVGEVHGFRCSSQRAN